MGESKVADVPRSEHEPLREAEAFNTGAVGAVLVGEGGRGGKSGTRRLDSDGRGKRGAEQDSGRIHKIKMTWER